jgi:hypothetical protein
MVDDADQPEGKRWRSAREFYNDYIGATRRLKPALKQLRSDLTRDIHEQTGVPWEEAAEIVRHNLIKRQEPGQGHGPKALQITDDAARLIPLTSRAASEKMRRLLSRFRHQDHDAHDPGTFNER